MTIILFSPGGGIHRKSPLSLYDSTITIVLLSPRMKEPYKAESDQWIPWEISYSLKEVKRADRTSRMNALLGVVLPDSFGSYSYMLTKKTCCTSGCTNFSLRDTFQIIKDNTFNRRKDETYSCQQRDTIHPWPFSYIHIVTWQDFLNDMDGCINSAVRIMERASDFKITKMV